MENDISVSKYALNFGLLLGLIAIAFNVIGYVTGAMLSGDTWYQWIFYLVFAVFIFFTVYNYRSKNGGFMTFTQALKVGVLTAVISGLISAIYNYFFLTVIEPDLLNEIFVKAEEKMLQDNPELTSEQLEMGLGIMRKMANPLVGGSVLIAFSAFFGFIYSLIAGLIWKFERTIS